MALSAKHGTFAVSTGTSNVAVTDVGFQPKLVLLGLSAATAADTNTNKGVYCFGAFASATQRACIQLFGTDAANISVTGGAIHNDACLVAYHADTIEGALDAVSLDSDGFTVVPDDAFPSDYLACYLALGGADLTDVEVGTFTAANATGNQTVTMAGSFTPTGIILFANENVSANGHVGQGRFGFGWAASSTARAASSIGDRDNQDTTDCWARTTTAECLTTINPSGGATLSAWDFVSFGAGQFTLNRATGTNQCIVGYIVWRGPQIAIGTTTTRTDTGTTAVTGLEFQPRCVLFAGTMNPTASQSSAANADARHSIGWAAAAGGVGVYYNSDHANVTADVMSRTSAARCIHRFDRTSIDTFTDEGSMDLDSLDANGFTVDSLVADTLNRIVPYLALGDAAAASTGLSKIVQQMMN